MTTEVEGGDAIQAGDVRPSDYHWRGFYRTANDVASEPRLVKGCPATFARQLAESRARMRRRAEKMGSSTRHLYDDGQWFGDAL